MLRQRDIASPAATNAVLPLRAAAVVMKTPAATAMTEAQTINNQIKNTETAAMTAKKITMETKGTAVAAVAAEAR